MQNNFNLAFTIYPNPVNDILNIRSTETIIFTSAEIYEVSGKLILSTKLIDNNVNLESLSTGSYVLILKDSNGNKYSRKFLKE